MFLVHVLFPPFHLINQLTRPLSTSVIMFVFDKEQQGESELIEPVNCYLWGHAPLNAIAD
jgi:hypothetical protein